jgi:hypothetical protein
MAYLKKKTRGRKIRGGKTLKKKRVNKKKNLVDIGVTRPRITGEPGMNQNLAVTNTLAKSMAQNRNMAQGLAASQALGLGQSLA